MADMIYLILGIVSVALTGCTIDLSASGIENGVCISKTVQPIMHGGASPDYLGLTKLKQKAIVGVIDHYLGVVNCTGVLVAPRRVVTARHCVTNADETSVILIGDEGEIEQDVAILDMVEHPSEDVLLLKLIENSNGSVDDIIPVPMRREEIGVEWVGSLVQLAGFGLTEKRTTGELVFAVETVSNIGKKTIVVDGQARSGACIGDSGGPLLTRGDDGLVEVIGIMQKGTASCNGTDTYIRMDVLRNWIEQYTDPLPAREKENCGGITEQGRCFFYGPVWCQDGSIQAESCGDFELCGWNDTEQGYRCVDPEEDPCAGSDARGRCEGDTAFVCRSGTLVATNCASCKAVCALSSTSGAALCVGR